MPNQRVIPCAGPGCDALMWRTGKGSLPPGQATCRKCRAAAARRDACCAYCLEAFESRRRSDGRWTSCCSKSCAQLYRVTGTPGLVVGRDPEKLKANYRAKNHRRRTKMRMSSDVTPAYERSLRAKAKKCPLCWVKLTDIPGQPASKELDHIVPINVGGTHTVGNVRIICRKCNGRRPYDGSDFTGQLTLWATDPDVVVKQPKPKKAKLPKVVRVPKPPKPKPQPRPCRACGTEIVPEGRGRPRSYCEQCRPSEYLRLKAAA